jgi:hypothetical protein
MKKLLTFGAVSFLCSAFFDPLIASGLGRPIPWLRVIVMASAGTACYYLLIKYRKQL